MKYIFFIIFLISFSSCRQNSCKTTAKRCNNDKLEICSKGKWEVLVNCKQEAKRLKLCGTCAKTPSPRCLMWEK